MKATTLDILVAYEDGYETGTKLIDIANPYDEGTDPHDAWAYGYSEGYRHAVEMIGESE